MTIGHPNQSFKRAMVLLLLGLLLEFHVLKAAEVTASNAASSTNLTVALEPQHADFTVKSVDVAVLPAGAFQKEPRELSSRIVRGILNFAGPSNAIPYLWDRDGGKLVLDLNRNKDLTDDPIISSSVNVPGSYGYQAFNNVLLPFDSAYGRLRVLVNMILWNPGERRGCTLSVRTFWQGKLTVAGQEWQVGLIPDRLNFPDLTKNSALLLRSWERRNEPFLLHDRSLDTIPFAEKIFFAGHAFRLSTAAGNTGDDFKPRLQFGEQTLALGDLKITGTLIRRLTFSGEPCVVVMDHPSGIVKVPAGTYSGARALLERGAIQAASAGEIGLNQRIVVAENTLGTLAIGGPLTNSVAITRHGRDMRLDYVLVGAGGRQYELLTTDRSHPPEFSVFKGEKKVASGNFEFG